MANAAEGGAALVSGRMSSDAVAISGSTIAADNVEANIGNLDATVSSRLVSASYTAPPSAATNASAVRTELTTELGRIDAAVSSRSSHTAADIWSVTVRTLTDGAGIEKNAALNAFPFLMVNDSDGKTPETGLAVTAQRLIDNGTFAACANSVVEVSNGWYRIDLAAVDLNGNIITLRFSATGARTREITIVTEP
jgi:hypothetical protein